MKKKLEQSTGDGLECIHHWLIDGKNAGVCKKCGVGKQFSSSWGNIQKSWYHRVGSVHPVVPVTKS